ncbi:MAG: FHIPEP family type III secretion protein, partial [Pseudomonadota bacterium]
LITLLNLVMGLAIGILAHDMPVGEAFETYAILTVGDGLVNQIPAVIISIAAALLLSKGGVLGSTDQALLSQLGNFPGALLTVAGLMALFAFVPGLPVAPFLLGAVVLGASAWWVTSKAAAESSIPAPPPESPKKSVGDMLDLDEIHVEFAADMVPAVMDDATGLGNRITNMRNHIAGLYGVVIPEIRLTDDVGLPPGTYAIKVQGVEAARATLEMNRVMVLLTDESLTPPAGIDAQEPVYQAPARWIAPEAQEEAALAGFSVITPVEVVATHLLETVKENFGRLFSRRSLRKLLDEFVHVSDPDRAKANRRLLDEFVPDKVPVDLLQTVLRLLLEERVSVRNLPLILEAIAEAKLATAAPEVIAEHVRHRLGFQLVAELTEADGALPMIQLSPEWEELFTQHQVETEQGIADIALPPTEFNRLANSVADKVASASSQGRYPAIVAATRRRRFLKTVLAAKGIRNPVLSFEEIGPATKPALIGMA